MWVWGALCERLFWLHVRRELRPYIEQQDEYSRDEALAACQSKVAQLFDAAWND
jgi:hypothetical protein